MNQKRHPDAEPTGHVPPPSPPSLACKTTDRALTFAIRSAGHMEGPGRGLQRDVVYLGWPIASSYMSPNWGEGGGRVQGLSQWVPLSPNKLWRSNSIFNLWKRQKEDVTWSRVFCEWDPSIARGQCAKIRFLFELGLELEVIDIYSFKGRVERHFRPWFLKNLICNFRDFAK